jgi:hypothetical protein
LIAPISASSPAMRCLSTAGRVRRPDADADKRAAEVLRRYSPQLRMPAMPAEPPSAHADERG